MNCAAESGQTPPEGSQIVSAEEVQRLAQLMKTLTDHSNRLEQAYRNLEERVAELDLELDRKNAALEAKVEELDRTTTHLHRVLDCISDGVLTFNARGELTSANPAAGEICGATPEALVGRSASDLLPDDVFNRLQELLTEGGRMDEFETVVWRLPAEADAEATPVPVQLSAVQLPAVTAAESEAPAEAEVMVQFADLSEVRELEERVRRSDRLRALGELAAGVAHEMRNPLTTVRGYIQLLPEEREDPEFVREMTRQILSEIDRLTGLTENLLNFARPTRSNPRPMEWLPWLQQLVTFERERLAQANVSVQLEDAAERAVVVSLDEARMRQVFLNLLQNSAEAMSNGGTITVSVHLEGPENRRWAITRVTDQGSGIGEDELEQIFNPFYTTKPTGSGLGLAITHRIVEEHQGRLRVESAPGRGTTVEVWLPQASGATADEMDT